MVDAPALGAGSFGSGGSSPLPRTHSKEPVYTGSFATYSTPRQLDIWRVVVL